MDSKAKAVRGLALQEKVFALMVFGAAFLAFLFLEGRLAAVQAQAATFTVGKGQEQCEYEITSDKPKKRTATLISISPDAKKLTVAMTETDPSTGKEYKITGVEAGAVAYHENLKRLLIGENVKAIGDYSFYGCKKLSKITLYAKHLKKIGQEAFENIKDGALIRIEAKNMKNYKQLKKVLKKSGTTNVKHQYRFR